MELQRHTCEVPGCGWECTSDASDHPAVADLIQYLMLGHLLDAHGIEHRFLLRWDATVRVAEVQAKKRRFSAGSGDNSPLT